MATRRNIQPRRKKRQSAPVRLSWILSQKKRNKAVRKSRVKRLYIPLTFNRKLVITLRKFRTNKDHRSKRFPQLVLPVLLSSVREIAISLRYRYPLNAQPILVPLLIIIMGITGAIYFGLNIDKPRVLEPVTSSSVPVAQVKQPVASTTPQALPHSEPVRIRIPKIAVDTSVIPVGRRADDTMEVPRDPYVVGWYKYAPTPGEIGPAVMVGHVDRIGGIAIFWRLRELQPGDQVEIDRADGKTAKFRVDEVRQFAQNNFPTQEVYGNLNYAGIRLITCGGVFNTQTRHYSDNTVVFGSLVI